MTMTSEGIFTRIVSWLAAWITGAIIPLDGGNLAIKSRVLMDCKDYWKPVLHGFFLAKERRF